MGRGRTQWVEFFPLRISSKTVGTVQYLDQFVILVLAKVIDAEHIWETQLVNYTISLPYRVREEGRGAVTHCRVIATVECTQNL